MNNKPIRVLHVISAMTNGGAETYMMYQYRNIDRNQVQFDFLTSREGEYAYNDEIRELGGKIYLIKPPTEQGAWGFVKDIRRILKEDPSIKVIHSHTFLNCGLAMLGGFLGGVKVRISHSHNSRTIKDSDKSGLKRKIYSITMRALIKLFATNYFACGNLAGENLFGKAFYGKKGRFRPNSIDLSRFENISEDDKMQLRKEFNIPDSVPVYTNVGRFMDQKNHKYLIKIARCLKDNGYDFRMLLVGEGVLTDEIKQLAKQNDVYDKVIFTGPRRDIPVILGITDVFLLPSLFEGLPVTIIEAQTSLTPSICSSEVTSQVDIGLDMVKFLGIEDSDLQSWVDQIKICEKKKYFDRNEVSERMKAVGYDSRGGAQLLCDTYLQRNK